MAEKNMYGAWFYSIPGIGDRTMEKIAQSHPDMEEFYRAGMKLWGRVLDARQLEQLKKFEKKADPKEWYEMMQEKRIDFVSREDDKYPGRLRNIPDPPYGLFFRGRLPAESVPAVAVIGARDCSPYGSYVAAGIGATLGEAGVQVISGMARGVDGISQEAALAVGGTSFGVLGCGVDVCYPKTNHALYDRLWECGGVLSFYAPGTEAKPQHFPPRNRIVSGLADALVVVEAREKSGTLITVDMALEQGKEVYAVPGRVTDRLSDGCNRLIRQGAGVFLAPEDLLREIGAGNVIRLPTPGQNAETAGTKTAGAQKPGAKTAAVETAGEKKADAEKPDAERKKNKENDQNESRDRNKRSGADAVLDMLTPEPCSLEMLVEKCEGKYKAAEMTAILMRLCLEGRASQLGTGWFCRKYP